MPTAEDFRLGVTDLTSELSSVVAAQRLCDQYTAAMATFESAHYVWAAKNQAYHEAPIGLRSDLWPGREPQPPAAPFAGAMVSP